MLYDVAEDPGSLSPSELRELYEEELRGVIEAAGIETVIEASGVDPDAVKALAAGESPALDLADAAAILAVSGEYPGATAIEAEARDELLMGMSIAVLDVETLSSGIDGVLEPKEIQAKMEGRFPMTLQEFALLHGFIEQRKR